MSLIFCKASNNRRKKYQIYTNIYQSNGLKWVEKESVYPQGQEHLRHIHDNMEILKTLYGDSYAVAPCELHGNTIRFPYIKGMTLEEKLLFAVKNHSDLNVVQKQFDIWLKIIEGNANNTTAFETTPEFEEIFGQANELIDCKALKVCNFDCSCENVIYNGNIPTIIDYEWVYTFPIPFDLILYRLLSDMYSRSVILRQRFELNQILSLCGVQAPVNILEQLSLNFYLSVIVEKDTQINTNTLGRCHTTSPVIPIKYDYMFAGTIYFDTGSGFSENEKAEFTFFQDDNPVNWDGLLPRGCKSIRFDPVEGFCCALHSLKISVGSKELSWLPLNGIVFDEYLFFDNLDPQIRIELPDDYDGQLTITASILPFKEGKLLLFAQETIQILKQIGKLTAQLETAKTELAREENEIFDLRHGLESIMAQLAYRESELSATKQGLESITSELACKENELSESRQELQSTKEQYYAAVTRCRQLEDRVMAAEMAYAEISGAFFWKITKPARTCVDRLSKIPFINLMIKGLKCLKQNGLKFTWHKVLTTLKGNRNPIQHSDLIVTAGSDLSYDVKVSVIIPTFQGQEYIKGLMTALNNQLGISGLEIIVVDSGSTDKTVEVAEQRGAKVIRISQAEFTHSYARNIGAEKATGDYLLFMTQDALPSGQYFISKLLTPIFQHGASAVSCIEKPYTDCGLFYRINNSEFIEYLGVKNSDRLSFLPDNPDYHSLRINGQLIDIACMVKRDVFSKFKYRGDFAEDLDLGLRIIRSGQKIALLSSVQVIHSHNRPCGYYLKRGYADTLNVLRILPGMPTYPLTAVQLMDATLCAYYKTVCLIDYLFANCREDMNLDESIKTINVLWTGIKNDDKIVPSAMPYGRSYTDETLENFISEMSSIYEEEFCTNNFLMEQVMSYINGSMYHYLNENNEPYDLWLRRNDQLADAIISRFALLAGAQMAQYTVKNPEIGPLRHIVEDLVKGV